MHTRSLAQVCKNGLLVVLSLVLSLFLIEGGARLVITLFTPNIMILDPELGWKQRPDARRTYVVEGHSAAVTTNEIGLRSAALKDLRAKARVLFLGDSFTAGLEVSNDELFSNQLAKLRPDLDILNAGVGGYGTVQELLFLRRLEPLVIPQLCVLMVYMNDLADNVMPFYEGIGPQPYADTQGQLHSIDWAPFDPLLLPLPGARWLHAHSVAAYLIRNRIWLPLRERATSAYVLGSRNAVTEQRKWELLETLIRTMSAGRNLIVVGLPTKENVAAKDQTFELHLAQLAQRVGVPFIDLQPALRVDDFLVEDIHWNVNGHKAVAAYLAQRLPRELTSR